MMPPPTETPEPGQIYQRDSKEPAYEVVHLGWQHPNHELWAQMRERKRAQKGNEDAFDAPFYVKSPRGAIGWVPWPGAKVAWPGELAWEMDLLQVRERDPKPSWAKNLR